MSFWHTPLYYACEYENSLNEDKTKQYNWISIYLLGKLFPLLDRLRKIVDATKPSSDTSFTSKRARTLNAYLIVSNVIHY